jgi:Protein of unknown function (DUF2877)
MATLPAHRVAAPVLERLTDGRAGVVLGAGATASWVDLDGFVVAVTTREVPLLPNAVALAAGSGSLQRAGAAPGTVARFAPGRIDLGTLRVTWDPSAPPAWDPTVPEATDAEPEALARRGAAMLGTLGVGVHPSADPNPELRAVDSRGPAGRDASTRAGVAGPDALVGELTRIGLPTAADPDGAAGLTRLFRAVRARDPEPAAGAARELLGRGPGLTPEGDDLLAAVAGTLAVLGPAAGWDRPVLAGFLAALAGPAPERTTALSATLLELAARRQLVEPAGRLLDLGPGAGAAWPAALARLERLGHGSGRAYAAGIAATTSLLAAGSPVG